MIKHLDVNVKREIVYLDIVNVIKEDKNAMINVIVRIAKIL